MYEKYLLYKLRYYTWIPSPEKSRKSTQRYDIFSHVFDTTNQLLTRHSPFAPLGQVDEWTAKPSRSSVQGSLSELFRITTTKTLKNLYRSQKMTFKLSQKGKKNNIRWWKPKVTYLMAFLAAENENRQLEDFPKADFGRLPHRLPLSVRTKSLNENFVHWKLCPSLFM